MIQAAAAHDAFECIADAWCGALFGCGLVWKRKGGNEAFLSLGFKSHATLAVMLKETQIGSNTFYSIPGSFDLQFIFNFGIVDDGDGQSQFNGVPVEVCSPWRRPPSDDLLACWRQVGKEENVLRFALRNEAPRIMGF